MTQALLDTFIKDFIVSQDQEVRCRAEDFRTGLLEASRLVTQVLDEEGLSGAAIVSRLSYIHHHLENTLWCALESAASRVKDIDGVMRRELLASHAPKKDGETAPKEANEAKKAKGTKRKREKKV